VQRANVQVTHQPKRARGHLGNYLIS
jgi:hypothetical protein